MIWNFRWILLLFFILSPVLAITGCSSSKEAQKQEAKPTGAGGPVVMSNQDEQVANLGLTVPRNYEPKGIIINYKADKELNFYDGTSHALMIAVYQLDNINVFNQLAKDLSGTQKLLGLDKSDKSVLGCDRYFIEPGEIKKIEIDRLENAKWLGIVAGYYDLVPAQAIRTYEIPIVIEKKGVYGFRKTGANMAELTVNLYLGSNSMQEVQNP
jgi:type VI secretion system VasD/TssJ family lipoprotein